MTRAEGAGDLARISLRGARPRLQPIRAQCAPLYPDGRFVAIRRGRLEQQPRRVESLREEQSAMRDALELIGR